MTIYNTANGALTSGISAFAQLLAQLINDIFVFNFLLFCCIRNPTQAITYLSGALYSANLNLVKMNVLDMGITIEISTSYKVTKKCATTIYNIANGALTSGISAVFQLLSQIINEIFVSNFLLFCCIQNPAQAITILPGALYSANVKVVETTVLDMGITIEITNSNNVTRTCKTTIYNTSNGALTSGISAFVQLLAQIINNIFASNFLLFCCIRNPKQAIKILSGALYSANV